MEGGTLKRELDSLCKSLSRKLRIEVPILGTSRLGARAYGNPDRRRSPSHPELGAFLEVSPQVGDQSLFGGGARQREFDQGSSTPNAKVGYITRSSLVWEVVAGIREGGGKKGRHLGIKEELGPYKTRVWRKDLLPEGYILLGVIGKKR